MFLCQPQQDWRLWRQVGFPARPFPLLFRRGSHAMVPLGRRDPFGKRPAGLRRSRDVATRFHQHATGTAHHRKATPLRCRHRQRALAQEQLGGDHRGFRLAMCQSQRAAHEGDFLQRPLAGPEKALVFPSPAITSGRRFQGQLLPVLHVAEQPHVRLVTATADPYQSSANWRLPLVLLTLRPVVDAPPRNSFNGSLLSV